jgi:hypothetical protein
VDFNENDLVVITGFIKKSTTKELCARIFEVKFVGLQDLLVTDHESKYSVSTIKVKKSDCIKIKPKISLNEKQIEPTIGSLVLIYETDWKGRIIEKCIGHVEEIHKIPGKQPCCIVVANNERKEANLDSLLLLEM